MNYKFDFVKNNEYCNSLTEYSRLKTREVSIGSVPLGANNPIRVQSMTTTDTLDTKATVEQSIRMIEAGCEYVRITAPSIKEAQNLEKIKKELRSRGYNTPLIADIHYTPNAAELAARIVEKVRVNPGNYADKKKFETIAYSDTSYKAELDRIRNRFVPLVKICKEYGTAMRIGANHGSLSDRILSRYGDTPLGMVESALEFLRICEDENFYNVVLSMKASNTLVMVQAYRLLVNKMMESGRNYPLHLGVTEAGDGEDGRIKSSVGIGTLLEDGLGDTIRVSLTEDPEYEIPVAKTLVDRYYLRMKSSRSKENAPNPESTNKKTENKNQHPHSPFEYKKRNTITINNIGSNNVPRVIIDFSKRSKITATNLYSVGYNYSAPLDKWHLSDQACDYIFAGDTKIDFEIPGTLGIIYNHSIWHSLKNKTRCYPLFTLNNFIANKEYAELNFVLITINDIVKEREAILKIKNNVVLVIETNCEHGMAEQRRIFFELNEMECKLPVIIKRSYSNIKENTFQLYSSTDFGALLIDGFGDGIWIDSPETPLQLVNSICFGILQAARTRISKTEYISCPSCGRTLFDLQETTAKIRLRTDHLKGIKIGIMGCIVNGPGEMADADYGYVGTGIGKVTLYKGKEVVQRNIDSEKAVDALIDLIKSHGD
ncbi:MAG: (E)-4-hydroxy-3-methylbut-2-enyl-diphosphate synthase, partial [Bacteroidia bacterium]|nr:(E)-4-hydroxy-3-methylbut-2-enyl-diphosphate synthase [Bacteroidia bacterium]